MCLESKFEAIVIKRLLEFLATSTATIKINFTDNTFGLKISIQFFFTTKIYSMKKLYFQINKVKPFMVYIKYRNSLKQFSRWIDPIAAYIIKPEGWITEGSC